MTANDSKSYLSYLNKLVDQYNNTYYHSALTEKIEMNPKALTFKVNDQVRITKYKNIFSKITLKIGLEKYLLPILF